MSISCDNVVRDFLSQRFPLPSRVWSFDLGSVSANANVYTNVVDLNENHSYTLLVARKIGVYSSGDFLEIQESADGVQWAPAWGGYGAENIARNKPSSSNAVFCVYGRPMARYIRVFYHNGSSAQSGLIIDLAAFGGV